MTGVSVRRLYGRESRQQFSQAGAWLLETGDSGERDPGSAFVVNLFHHSFATGDPVPNDNPNENRMAVEESLDEEIEDKRGGFQPGPGIEEDLSEGPSRVTWERGRAGSEGRGGGRKDRERGERSERSDGSW